jgi:3-carboxy-cis,cis-muconate cycloisomerase
MKPSSSSSDGLFTGVLGAGAVRAAVADDAWLRALLDAEAALALAAARVGLIPAADATAIAEACAGLAPDVAAIGREAAASGTPVVPVVRLLRAGLPDSAARAVHLGATSQDIVDTAAMLVAQRALSPLVADLAAAAESAAGLADRHRATPVAGRTLLQQALPTTFGLVAAGWLTGLDRARRRLADVRAHGLAVQLGGAVGTLAAYRDAAASAGGPVDTNPDGGLASATGPVDTDRDAGLASATGPAAAGGGAAGGGTAGDGAAASGRRGTTDPGIAMVAAFAAELGLAEPDLPWHTERTRIADLAGALGAAAGAIAKVARDITLYAQTEVGEVAEGGGAGGSSTMPHKHNPIRAVSAAAAAAQAPGLVAALLAAMPQEYQRAAGAWHAEWLPLRALLETTGSAAVQLRQSLAGLRVDAGRMRANLDLTRGALLAERVAGALRSAVGAEKAHELVREAAAAGDLAGDPRITEHLAPGAAAALLDPGTYLGSADALIDRALAAARRE